MKSARDGLPRNTSEIGTETESLSGEDKRQVEWGSAQEGSERKEVGGIWVGGRGRKPWIRMS